MKKESMLYGLIGLLVGAAITWGAAVVSVNGDHTGIMNMMGIHSRTDDMAMMSEGDMTMGEMSANLENKTGDDFDKAFLGSMVAHHQGAITMAKLAQTSAKHDEIKNMAKDIISAQSKEINMMQTWQSSWGYTAMPTSHTMMNR
jgi:uncharacterized protein (DUF305 family)